MDGRAGTADALEDTSDQAGLEGGAQVGHTAGNSDIVRRVIEDEDEDYPRGTSVSIEKAGTGEMATGLDQCTQSQIIIISFLRCNQSKVSR